MKSGYIFATGIQAGEPCDPDTDGPNCVLDDGSGTIESAAIAPTTAIPAPTPTPEHPAHPTHPEHPAHPTK